uniref:TSA: Wollemia nobilis Ref_Wollemi_Transcript_9939_1401 transcribed RNA sequence n=1 Tax=Wollemia nobilis TaxID=56998 RepID=A0A0C9S717_9CONI
MIAMESTGATLTLRGSFGANPTSSNSRGILLASSRSRRLAVSAAHKNKSDDEKNTKAAEETSGFPLIKFHGKESTSLQRLSKDTAMGLVLKAAGGTGWTTGSGMEGPAVSAGLSENTEAAEKSIYPWSLFTKSPRRRMRVAFTCGVCGQRTTRAINPHAYTDGTVFVQCAGCDVYHKLVDNLNLFHELKGSIYPRFDDASSKKQPPFKFLDMDDFPLF